MLLETLVYTAVLVVILGMAILAYDRFAVYSQRLRAVTADISRTVDAGERWREDIRKAIAPIQFDEKSGELRIPQEGVEVSYRFQDGEVVRREGERSVPVLAHVKHSAMQQVPRAHVVSWRWEVELKTRGKNAKVQPLFQFEAVAPGKS
ncbi:MAG: hypothetical protein ACK4UN_10860 [Limisphaerales bacterium]